MSIAVYTTEQLFLDRVASILSDEGIEVRAIHVEALRDLEPFGPEIQVGVLILSKHGAGDPTARFRRLLSGNRPLLLCTPRPEAGDYEKLIAVGATEILTPRTWAPEHVAERILAQLILAGDLKSHSCGDLFGGTRAMRDLYDEMKVIAPLSDPVLITGETGTGKELIAREIHRLSKRTDRYQPINCGELTSELTGSELFGHDKGSFSGATDARQGLFAEAGEGSVFLDEIGELDLKAQAFLLRVLEEKKVRRVGSNRTESVPARVVLATNRNLELECQKGKFRQDLFERIRGFTIELKPLRERRADISLLAHHFLDEANSENTTEVRVPHGALDCLFGYEWPGNVRELRSSIRKAAAFADADGFLSSLRLLETTRRPRIAKGSSNPNAKYYCVFDPAIDTWRRFLTRAQKTYFQAALDVAGGNRKEARRMTGLGSSQFYENLRVISTAEVEDKENEGLSKAETG